VGHIGLGQVVDRLNTLKKTWIPHENFRGTISGMAGTLRPLQLLRSDFFLSNM